MASKYAMKNVMRKLFSKLCLIAMSVLAVAFFTFVSSNNAMAADIEVLEALDSTEVVSLANNSEVVACGYQVMLNAKLEVRYYMKLSDRMLKEENTNMVFLINGVRQWADRVDYVDNYVYYVCKVVPKDMSTPIEASFYNNGTYYYVESFSVKDYLANIITNKYNRADYKAAREVCLAALEYGACAQIYFNYRTDDLADEGYEVYKRTTVKNSDIVDNVTHDYNMNSNQDFGWMAYSLILNSGTSIRTYWLKTSSITEKQIKEKYDIYVLGIDNKDVIVKDYGSFFTIELSGIPIAEIDNAFLFVIKDKTNYEATIMREISCLTYFVDALKYEEPDKENLKNLCKAMYLYNIAAESYFDKYTLISSNDDFGERGTIGCDFDSNMWIEAGSGYPICFSGYSGKLNFIYSNDNVIVWQNSDGSYYYKAKNYGNTVVSVTDSAGNHCEFTVKAYSAKISIDEKDSGYEDITAKVGDSIKISCEVIDPYGQAVDYTLGSYGKHILSISEDNTVSMVGMGTDYLYLSFSNGDSKYGKSLSRIKVTSKDGLYCSENVFTVSNSSTVETISFENASGKLSYVSDSNCVEIAVLDSESGATEIEVTYANTGVAHVKVTDGNGKTADITIIACYFETYYNKQIIDNTIYLNVGDTFSITVDMVDPSGSLSLFVYSGPFNCLEETSMNEAPNTYTFEAREAGEAYISVNLGTVSRTYEVVVIGQ